MLGTLSAQTIRFPITPTQSLVVKDLYYDLSLAPDGFWAACRNRGDGADIRVYKQDGVTPVAREVTGFDYANKTGFLWFAAGGASAFYIQVGSGEAEPAANSTYGKNSVWESNAQLVAHFGDFTDSTGKRTLTQGSSYLVDGKLGKGMKDDGANHVITNYDANVSGDFTVKFWFYTDASGAFMRLAENDYDKGFWCGYNGGWGGGVKVTAPPFGAFVTLSLSAWHSLTMRRSGTECKVFGDGGAVTSSVACPGTAFTNTNNLHIGHSPAGAGPAFGGIIDEFRFYDRALSDDEIAQMYANQNDPAAFWTTGAAG